MTAAQQATQEAAGDGLVLCAFCRTPNPANSYRCARCNARLYLCCERCGERNERNRARCAHCGHSLKSSRLRRLTKKLLGDRTRRRILIELLLVILVLGLLFVVCAMLAGKSPPHEGSDRPSPIRF